MADLRGAPIAESIKLDPKQFIDEDQLLELWETRGMKYRCDEFWQHLRDRGLQPHMRKEVFRGKVLGFLRAFLVQGEVRRDPRHQPPPKKLKMR
jgi:hypothetical protein